MKILELGCGNNKYYKSFGVDIQKTKCADLVWDLNKKLPKTHHNKYDLVTSDCLIDHLLNPFQFLLHCKLYAKKKGKIEVIVDNASYWAYQRKEYPFGNYHSTMNFGPDLLNHKMMFQLEHLERLFRLAGIEITESKYCRSVRPKSIIDYIDLLYPKYKSCNRILVSGKAKED